MEILQELHEKRKKLHEILHLIRVRGEELANAEREYKIQKAQLIMRLRQEEHVPISIVRDIAIGDRTISDLRAKRDIARMLYHNAQEAIHVYKLEIRLLESQLKMEWNMGIS